jgi:murein DD-endopeptidase MepM/ murein hydrolase activator NlpD
MSSSERTGGAIGVLSAIARALLMLSIAFAAACSSDVTRFDFGGKSTTSSIPLPSEPVGGGGNGPPRGVGLTEAPLPPPDQPGNYRVVGRQYDRPLPSYMAPSPAYTPPAPDYGPPPSAYGPAPHPAGPAPAYRPLPAPGGETIEVQPGETLFTIARRHGVAIAAIKDANGLTSETVRPGQRLVIPGGLQPAPFDRTPVARAPATMMDAPPAAARQPSYERTPLAKHTPAPARSLPSGAEPPPGWEGRYTMKNGDSLYGIALQHRVSLDELMRANNITDPTKVWAGTVLAVPERAHPDAEQAPKGPPRIVQVPPRVINSVSPDAAGKLVKRDIEPEAAPYAEAASGKFRWPARGKIILGFGKRPDGGHNDGINLSLPMGSDIHAVEGGRVAYAGNELKGYGNLILIRHPNGWVSAYAHADQLLVRANDDVRRGQVIAKAGMSGSVDQPQLHFELRQGSRPVDPLPHLAN